MNASTAPLLPTTVAALPQMDLTGFRQLLGQLRGTPVVVNIWSSQCGPCRGEAPRLAEAGKRYGDRVQFLGVDNQDTRSLAQQFIAQYRWTYPSVFDPEQSILHGLYFVGPPVTLFYDRSGKLAETPSLSLTPETLAAGIQKILAAPE